MRRIGSCRRAVEWCRENASLASPLQRSRFNTGASEVLRGIGHRFILGRLGPDLGGASLGVPGRFVVGGGIGELGSDWDFTFPRAPLSVLCEEQPICERPSAFKSCVNGRFSSQGNPTITFIPAAVHS